MNSATVAGGGMGISGRSASRGFTLIELLIALTISVMLLALLSQAFFMITRQWEGRFEVQFSTLEQSRQLFLLRRSIAHAIPFIPPKESFIRKSIPLFSGTSESVLWVTSAAVFLDGPALAHLHKNITSSGDTVWRYSESPPESMFTSLEYPDQGQGNAPQLTFSAAEGQEFRYFGYASLNGRLHLAAGTEPQTQPQWFNRYDSNDTGQIPGALALLDIESGERFFEVVIKTNDLKYTHGTE